MTAQAPLDLSVIIVSWNVCGYLRNCLGSLYVSPRMVYADPAKEANGAPSSGKAHSGQVIVVDNASNDGSVKMVRAEFPKTALVVNDENRGFTAANNQGLAISSGRYVLFLNPDTEVVGNALATMVDYMDAHPEVGALGPELRYGDGSLQSSRRRFPDWMTALFESTPLAWHWPDNRWARRYRMEEGPQPQRALPVDWVVGAALLARRETLAQIGGFDEGYFMYSEELDWCKRAHDAGWQTVYLPSVQVVHHEGKSSEQVVAARHIRFQTSKVRYFGKFHGPAAAETLRLALLGAFAGEWLLESAKWALGSKKTLRRERMAAYRQLLQSGLRAGNDRPVVQQTS
jgi:hypothetical protein